MSSSSDISFKVLSDQPTKNDKFDSHLRIAKAIESLVTRTWDASTIALMGKRGSGKSSIIEMLRKALTDKGDDAQVELFIFDAWSHQGDALRRVFLERLADHLLKTKPQKDNQKWEDDFERKTHPHQKTNQKTSATVQGVALGLAAFLVSYGLLLLSKSTDPVSWIREMPFLSLFDSTEKVGNASILLAASALILAIAIPRMWGKGFFFELPLLNLSSQIVTSAAQTIEPTSVEFEKLFSDLMKRWGEKSKSLLIVIDNLDRVPSDDVMQLWSTLQVFLRKRVSASDPSEKDPDKEWVKRLWILVPFDRDSLARELSDVGLTSLSQPRSIKSRADKNPKPNNELRRPQSSDAGVSALLDKAFPITFQVPLPVSSAWEAYFNDQFKYAFPKAGKSEPILAIYRLSRKKKGQHFAPTPRDINLFLNRLGALYLQWPTDIRLEIQALYSYFSDDLSRTPDLYEGIREMNLLSEDIVFHIDYGKDQCLRQLAALHFGVKPDKALQMLIDELVREVVFEPNADTSMEKIKNLMHDCSEGFAGIVANIIEGEKSLYAKDAGQKLCAVASNLAQIEEFASGIPERKEDYSNAWRHLCKMASRVESWADCNREDVRILFMRLNEHGCAGIQRLTEKMMEDYRKAERKRELDPGR